jgi:hypothetical protein
VPPFSTKTIGGWGEGHIQIHPYEYLGAMQKKKKLPNF